MPLYDGGLMSSGSFDHEATYYRVIGNGNKGYAYSEGEPTVMETASGHQRAQGPIFEFDSLSKIGNWLYLGNRVRRLRVPVGARVVRNEPMSQGGCYTFGSDRIELLDVVDFATLMRELDATKQTTSVLHLESYEFSADFSFPERVSWLILDRCLAVAPLAFPSSIDRLALWNCALAIARFPERIDELEASNCLFEGVTELPTYAREQSIRNCTLI